MGLSRYLGVEAAVGICTAVGDSISGDKLAQRSPCQRRDLSFPHAGNSVFTLDSCTLEPTLSFHKSVIPFASENSQEPFEMSGSFPIAKSM